LSFLTVSLTKVENIGSFARAEMTSDKLPRIVSKSDFQLQS